MSGKFFGSDDPGEKPDFATLLEECMQGLEFLTSNHGVWRFGQEERWDLHQGDGDLIFTFPDGIVTARAQIIGSFDTSTSMWLWAWANPSVAEHLKRDALRVLEYGKHHNFERLTTAEWKAEEMDGWYMAALANSLCRRNGAYRGPVGTMRVFITFGEIVGSLLGGKLNLEFLEANEFPEEIGGSDGVDSSEASTPDFSHITSKEDALKLAAEGKLFKLLIFPKAFSGADIPQNVVYVPPGVLEIQDRITRLIRAFVRKGLNIDFSGKPEFKGNSFVPAKLHYKASHPETNWNFERTIDIW